MPPNLPKDILKLAVELIKHQAKKQLGDGFIDVLSSRLVDYAGDNALEKVNALLESGENADKLLAAFQDADKDFHDQGDDTLRQMIVSKPLSQLESLEKLAKALPKTLDDDGLLEALRHHFETDWPKHSAEDHVRAARAYRLCLERSLAVRCNQILPSIFSKVERIEENTEKILDKLDSFKPSQSAAASNWYLPFPRNEKFVGRDDDLQQLHAALQQGESVGVRPAMLSGMGGIGKTQLSVEYAYRYQAEYPGGIYWVNAAQDFLLRGMADTAEKIGLYPTDDVPESQRLTWLANAFAKHINAQKDSLVIFDNVEDPKVLRLPVASIIPTELKCHILFTTRRRDVDKTFYRSFEVTVLPESAALQLLLRHPARQPILDPKHNDYVIARIICRTLGFLPLAIELAGAYLGTYDEIPLWDYRKRLLGEGAMETVDDTELRPEDMPTRHDTAIHATLKLSWEAIQDDEDAQLALKAAGQLREAEMISIRLLSLLTGIENKSSTGKPSKINRALKKLYEFSLVEKLTAESLRLHPLVFAFASGMADNGFRVGLADRLSEKLCNVEALIQIAGEYGIDTVLADTGVGLWLYGSVCNKLKDELSILNLLINNDSHALRSWNPKEQPGFLPGQLYNRALMRKTHGWQILLHEYLEAKEFLWFQEKHEVSRVSPSFLRTFEGHANAVNGVAITPDGTRAISASDDTTLRLWDLQSGESLREFEGHTYEVKAVVVTPDGTRALSASWDSTLRLWDLQSGELLRTLEGHNSVAITPDGTRALSASDDSTLRLWDLESGESLRIFEGHAQGVFGLAITPDGKRAIAASNDSTLRLWDLESGESLRIFEGHAQGVFGVAITPDGKRAISASWDRTLRLWDLQNGKLLRTFEGHTDNVTGVAVTPDGKHALSASNDRTLRLWDLESGESLRIFEGHAQGVVGVAITPDGKSAISASWDRTLRLWDLQREESLRKFEGHTAGVNGVAITPDGKHAISASWDYTLRSWDIQSGESLRKFEGHTDKVNSVAITPDGKRAISASVDMTLRLWDLQNGKLLRTFEGHTFNVTGVAVTPDGKHAISASNDSTLRLWDLESGESLRTFEGHTSSNVLGVAVTPNGKRAISASADKSLHLWDLESGELLRTFEGHRVDVNAVAITPDGKRAVSASWDSTLRLWDLESGECLRTFKGHTNSVEGVAIIPDGKRAISASLDGTLRLWDLQSGKCLLVLASDAWFQAVTICPNGNMLIAGDSLGAVHFIEIHNLKP